TVVSVEEGTVMVRHRLLANGEERELNGGDEIRVYRDAPLAKSKIDKGGLAKRMLDAARDVAVVIWQQGGTAPGSGGGGSPVPGGGSNGPLPGDTETPDAPAPPPPPPPPGDAGAPPAPPAP